MSATRPSPARRGRSWPLLILVMGVSGCGKTSVGLALAARLGCRFVDADNYHPPSNVAKMRSGIPLDDQDREPWLARLNALLRHSAARGESVVLACSALRERYRAQLSARLPTLEIVHLRGDFQTIAARLATRNDHYMPVSLLRSQFDALEAPALSAFEVDITPPVQSIVETLLTRFSPCSNTTPDL